MTNFTVDFPSLRRPPRASFIRFPNDMWNVFGVANETATWLPEPTQRGSWGLLSTCLTTIGLCVWTTVHLNIPGHKHTKRHFWTKLGLAALGLFAPEIVTFYAFEEWRVQRRFHQKMVRHLNPPSSDKTQSPSASSNDTAGAGEGVQARKYHWTQWHSFYATMGGFAFDNTGKEEEYPLPDHLTRATLMPHALVYLAIHEPQLIPDISELSIRDKNKSEGIAKVIAFWQALWFAAQFLTRLIQGLHVSLLEFNTFLHVICAVISYFVFWFKKPLDVMEPTLIPVDSAETAELCAAMSVVSHMGRLPVEAYNIEETSGEGLPMLHPSALATVALVKAPGLLQGHVLLPPMAEAVVDDVAPPPIPLELPDECTVRYSCQGFYPDDSREAFFHECRVYLRRFWKELLSEEDDDDEVFPPIHDLSITVSKTDLTRYCLAARGLAKHPALRSTHSTLSMVREAALTLSAVDLNRLVPWVDEPAKAKPKRPVQAHVTFTWANLRQFVVAEVLSSQSPFMSLFGFYAASAIYGGLHLLFAWDGPMHTATEVVLWRISGFGISSQYIAMIGAVFAAVGVAVVSAVLAVIVGFFVFLVFTLSRLSRRMVKKAKQAPDPRRWKRRTGASLLVAAGLIMLVALYLVLFASGVLFLFSRVYIVAECFIALPYAPSSVYQLPLWTTYISHF